MNEQADALRQIADIAARYDLSPEQVARVLRNTAQPDQRERSSSVLAKVLAYLGGIFVLAGISLFIGMQWETFIPAVRVMVTLGTGFAIYLFALATMTDRRFAGVTTPMLLISALLQPTGIVVMLNEYSRGGDPQHGLLFMCTVMFVQQFLTFLARRRTVLLFTSLFFGAAGFGTLCGILDVDFEITALALGIGLTSVTFAIDQTRHAAITPFWYFAGTSFFLYGAFDVIEDTPLEIIYFGIAAGVMYLGTVLRSRTMLFLSVIALTGFTGYYFRESLFNAFGLVLMGMLLIGLSAFAMKLSRRFNESSP